MIKFMNVCFLYDEEILIQNLTFEINKGDFVSVIGSNGAGKSTITKIMNGLLKPSSGDVYVKGMNTKEVKSSKLAGFIGYLFQNPDRQICQNTIKNEIMFGLTYTVSDNKRREMRCDEIIKKFEFDENKDPFNISRGERQRVALASILACEPEILILDEPTTGLDYRECMQTMSIIKELNEKGTTIIMVTHDMEIVQEFSKKVMVMSDGSILGYDKTDKIMCDVDILRKARVSPAQIAELSILLGSRFKDIVTVDEMVHRILNLRGVQA